MSFPVFLLIHEMNDFYPFLCSEDNVESNWKPFLLFLKLCQSLQLFWFHYIIYLINIVSKVWKVLKRAKKAFNFTQHCLHCIKKGKSHRWINEKIKNTFAWCSLQRQMASLKKEFPALFFCLNSPHMGQRNV